MSKSYRDLFKGTAWYYARYRYAYSPEFFAQLAEKLQLDGTGRLLDLGCGTGQLTIPLSHHFEEAVGLDPEPEMLEQAALSAEVAGVTNVRWVEGGSADLPHLDLGTFKAVTMGNSFHWMDQHATLVQLDRMVEPGGKLAIMGTSSGGSVYEVTEGWPFAVRQVLDKMLGETRRAGTGTYQGPGETFEGVLARLPFSRFEYFEMEDTRYLTADEVIGFLYSTSYASKAVLGDHQAEFEQEIRRTLLEMNPENKFPDKIIITAFLAERPS